MKCTSSAFDRASGRQSPCRLEANHAGLHSDGVLDWDEPTKPPALEQRSFDPDNCDHGSEHGGLSEWTWCENCDPTRYAAAMADLEQRDDKPFFEIRPPGCKCHWEEGDSECPVHAPSPPSPAAAEQRYCTKHLAQCWPDGECARCGRTDKSPSWTEPPAPPSPTAAELPVNSVGTCSLCGYHGPGPRHDCRPKPAEQPAPDDLADLPLAERAAVRLEQRCPSCWEGDERLLLWCEICGNTGKVKPWPSPTAAEQPAPDDLADLPLAERAAVRAMQKGVLEVIAENEAYDAAGQADMRAGETDGGGSRKAN